MNTILSWGRRTLRTNPTINLASAGVALIASCYGLARFGYGFFTPVFRTEFSLSPAMVGLFASASYIAYCLAVVCATALTAGLGARVLCITAGGLSVLSMLAIACAPNGLILGLAVASTGLCTGLVSPPLASLVAERIPANHQNKVQTIVNSGAGIGVILTVPIALLAGTQWRIAWLIFAAAAAAVTYWVIRASVNPYQSKDHDAPRGGQFSLSDLIPKPLFPVGSIQVMSAATLYGMAGTGVMTFGRDYLLTVGRQAESATTIAWVLLGTCGLLGAVSGGLVTKFGVAKCWILGSLTLALSVTLVALAPSNTAIAMIAMSLFGTAYMVSSGFLLIWSTIVYRNSPSTGVGATFLVIALAQAAITPILGVLSSVFGSELPFYLTAALALIGSAIKPKLPPPVITALIEIIPTPTSR